MRTTVLSGVFAAALLISWNSHSGGQEKAPAVYPTALFPFAERGSAVKEFGAKVSDILFAKLVAKPELYLVDRAELKKTLEEQALNLSGVVKSGEATQVGQLTGAKLLVTGSVFQVDKRLYLIAKVIGTETSRVAGASVDGKVTDELAPLVEKLADALAETIAKQADKLVAKPASSTDRLAALKQKLKKGGRPVLFVRIPERHVGQLVFDPAAQTEVLRFCRGTGFEIIDAEEGSQGKADVLLTGEGISELAGRVGNLVSVKARVELKAVDRKSGKGLAADRQTAVVVDLTEQIAGKSALQQAAAAIAERMLPRLVKE
jgi:TolB-like protein